MNRKETKRSDTHSPAARKPSWRIPIRWHWAMLVGGAVLASVLVLLMIILDLERHAWLDSQARQAEVQVDRLADELKIPLLAGSAEADLIIKSFLDKVPAVLTIRLKLPGGMYEDFGQKTSKEELPDLDALPKDAVVKLAGEHLWFGKRIVYAGTPIGSVAVRFSEKQWHELVAELVTRILLASAAVILLSGILVFWLAGRMSRPLERLAQAAKRVAAGDYTVQLPVSGYNEIADATRQFNDMVKELAHKEELRNVFGRYLNPKLVSEVFDGDGRQLEGFQRDVTVLFADMVGFTSFAEATRTEQVIEVLNAHFGVFHRIIDHFDGHVDKYIGDAVMAVFNHPRDDKEHARHAAMAALAMVEACNRLRRPRPDGGRIQFRMGLNCGEVIVGNIGADERLQYTVIGNAVNVASRVCNLGDGGQVIVPLATFERMGPGFAFDPIGDRLIKGVSEPLRCGMIRAMAADVRERIDEAVNAAFDTRATIAQGADA